MADYYPLIARAISGLDVNAPGEQRRALYERARVALIAQLRGVEPSLSESEITRERLALEEAVRKVESEAAQRAREASRGGGDSRSGDAFRAASRAAMKWLSSPSFDPLEELARLLQTDPLLESRRAREIKKPVALPPISVLPEQNKKGAIAFRSSRRGPLDLQRDTATDFFDPEQSQLYLRIRAQLTILRDETPKQERQQIDAILSDFLNQPPQWEQVEFKKVLWLSGNALRRALSQHDAVSGSADPHYLKLPPGVAESLRNPIEAWNIFVWGDADLSVLDAKRIGPQEQHAIVHTLTTARPIVENAAESREITTEQAARVLSASLKTADFPDHDLNTKQAQDLANGTSRNLIVQIVRRAYLFCQDLIDPKTEEAKALVAEYKAGVAKGAGLATVPATLGVATLGAHYAGHFFEFVVENAIPLKAYLAAAFQNDQLTQVINTIEQVRLKIRNGM
jgi:hypothetical protein